MVTLPVEAWKLEGISPRAYQHPADRAATAALQKVPYLDEVVRRLIALGYERALRAAALGASVRLGEHQLPNIWVLQRECFNALDLARVPDLYLTQVPFANAVTIGTDRPVVVLNSELVRILGDDGRRAVLAHEAGHVHSNHVLYQTALLILMRLSSAVRLPVLAGLPIMAIQFALLQDMSLTHPCQCAAFTTFWRGCARASTTASSAASTSAAATCRRCARRPTRFRTTTEIASRTPSRKRGRRSQR